MHSFTVNCDTFLNEEKVAAVVPVPSVEVTCSEEMLSLSFSSSFQFLPPEKVQLQKYDDKRTTFVAGV